MLLPLFLALARGVDGSYSLFAPFAKTNMSEIGNWTMRGSAVNMKKYLRLTSSSIGSEFSSVCHRVPTLFHEWAVDFEISVNEGFGSEITFLFTDEVCPQSPEKFKGFQVTINNSAVREDGTSPLLFSENKLDRAREVARWTFVNAAPVTLKFTRSKSTISCDVYDQGAFKRLFEESIPRSPYFGYFTVSAASTAEYPSTCDLVAFRTHPLSEYEAPQFDENLLNLNRKIIETDALRRRQEKKQRRTQQMPTMERYVDEMNRKNKKLSNSTPEREDAFKLIWEAENRGANAATIDQLMMFISSNIVDAVAKAGGKINNALEKFDETKDDMNSLWVHLREKIVDLAMSAREEMRKLEQESIAEAKKINLAQLRFSDVGKVNKAAGSSGLTMALIVIAVIEAIAYIAFFVVKHRKTKGFRKID